MLQKPRAKEEFNIEPISSSQMEQWVQECINIYRGEPSWLSEDENIDTVNFAKSICSEVARLTMLATSITVDGSARAEWLQERINEMYFQLREWIEYGCAYGTIILKPDGQTVRMYTPGEFEVTDSEKGNITGIVFHNWEKEGDKWYTLLEYHRFEGEQYAITNKCYLGDYPDDTKKQIDIALSPWSNLAEEVYINNVDRMLFGVFRTPQANNIDLSSPCGLPIFSEAVQELRDLDIAYSRNAEEIFDSSRTVLLDSDAMMPGGGKRVVNSAAALAHRRQNMKLPRVVKNIQGDGKELFYQEINPQLNTEMRLKGLNALLNQIGYKSGFSNGHFVFNESGGIQTATQVEADQQRTIQMVKDVRDRTENCTDGVVYALDVFADLYGYAPSGDYEIVYDFGDITYNRDEDRARWWGYVQAGKVPAWKFFVKFEGMSEEDAKAMVEEAAPKQPTLFGREE
jgi:A118 family predicted phage portal protein